MTEPVEIPIRHGIDRATFEALVGTAAQPVVLEGLVRDWPIVQAGLRSRAELARSLKNFDAGRRPHVIEAPPEAHGCIFYRDDHASFNFTRRPADLSETLDRLLDCADAPAPPAIFLESMSATAHLPGFAAAHRMP